jgi:hypothetical protein
MSKKEPGVNPELAILSFRKGDKYATIVTDDVVTRSYEDEGCRSHDSLKAAIAYLESKQYHIITDKFD